MKTEERWEFLYHTAKRVLLAYREGRNPNAQLDKLAAALACVEDMRICGRRLIDRECDWREGIVA